MKAIAIKTIGDTNKGRNTKIIIKTIMINEKLYDVAKGIELVSSLKGVKFAYAIAKNRNAIKAEIAVLQETIKFSEKFTEYDKKRIELCENYADKNDKGKAVMTNNEYVITDKIKFNKEIKTLQKEYSQPIKEREAQVKEFSALLQKESVFKPYMIAYEDVPADITAEAMNKIIELVEAPK